MNRNYTKYKEAKQFFYILSNRDETNLAKEAQEILNFYTKLKEDEEEFTAALFILNTYLQFCNESSMNLGTVING